MLDKLLNLKSERSEHWRKEIWKATDLLRLKRIESWRFYLPVEHLPEGTFLLNCVGVVCTLICFIGLNQNLQGNETNKK